MPNLEKRSICIDTRPLTITFTRDLFNDMQYNLIFNKPIVIPVEETASRRHLEEEALTSPGLADEGPGEQTSESQYSPTLKKFFEREIILEIEGLNQD